MIRIGGKILRVQSKNHKLDNLFGIRRNFLISGRSPLLYQFTRRATKLTVVIIAGYHCYQLHTELYPISFPQGYVYLQMKLVKIFSVDFDITDQLSIRFFALIETRLS
jgi:hypothetical protein